MTSNDTIFGWAEWQYREAAQRLIERGDALQSDASGVEMLANLQRQFETVFSVPPQLEWGSGQDAARFVGRAWSLAKTECVRDLSMVPA